MKPPRRAIAAPVMAAAVILFVTAANACSLATPRPFQSDAKLAISGETPPPVPIVSVAQIQRGEYHPGKQYSICADVGFIALAIPADDTTRHLTYQFDLVSGVTEDEIFHNGKAFTTDYEEDGKLLFVFAWLDSPDEAQKPLDLRVRVTAMTKSGLRGNSTEIAIRDPGRR
ncbi:MAG: hypothetical protein HY243_08825 [Proteobacteria bacterium]|nr:hypothetical protein [Pseudomonadota bacterium]